MENINWAGFSSSKLCDPVLSSVIVVPSLTDFADSLKLGMEQKKKRTKDGFKLGRTLVITLWSCRPTRSGDLQCLSALCSGPSCM
jgi:hypothetical protein